MMDAQELYRVAQGAAGEAIAFIAENVAKNPDQPTPEEANGIATALLLLVAQIEARVKAYLPPESRHNVRAFLDNLSARVGTMIEKSEKIVDSDNVSGTI